jgi:hypothetical protein
MTAALFESNANSPCVPRSWNQCVTINALQCLIDLTRLGFGFVQQNAVDIKPSERFDKTLALYCANAVDIPGDYFYVP